MTMPDFLPDDPLFELPNESREQTAERRLLFQAIPNFGMCEIVFIRQPDGRLEKLISVYAANTRRFIYHYQNPDYASKSVRDLVCRSINAPHEQCNELARQLLELGLLNSEELADISNQWDSHCAKVGKHGKQQ